MKTDILPITLFLLLLAGCTPHQEERAINRSRVVANPIDLDYPFEAAPDPAVMKQLAALSQNSSMFAPQPDALRPAQPVSPADPVDPFPGVEQVKAARQALVMAMMRGENRPRSMDVTGARTAADPVMTRFQGKYYLFHSGAEGYWTSDDMQHWTHHEANFPAGVAPTVMVYEDEMYYITSRINQIYKTATPLDGMSWQPLDTVMVPYLDDPAGTAHDPYLYTEDGRVYFYWESDYLEPIKAVEYDPANHFLPTTAPIPVIERNWARFGYEVPGDRNEKYELGGYLEGAIMTKHGGRYYLQYATCGTEFDAYADGVYVGDSPLGPFTPMVASPMSLRIGGFTTSAGHGDTFQDEYGNYWHLSTNIIGQREMFERRISLYPVVFTERGNMYTLTWFGDYPYELPTRKVDFLADDVHTGWMNLSLGKTATASSEIIGYEAGRAADNTIKTWWAARTGLPGEFIQIDLGHTCTVQAVQPNFADHNFGYQGGGQNPYCYVVEGSPDGETWSVLVDHTTGGSLRPHELLVLPEPARVRYVRVTNRGELAGSFSLFDLRVFGSGNGQLPTATAITSIQRDPVNPRRIRLNWEANPEATGYLLRWGAYADELYTSMEVYDETSLDLGCFDGEADYWFTLDTFNENGVTRGTEVHHIPANAVD